MGSLRFRLLLGSLAAASLFAADFESGQGARLVIGQPSFTAERPGLSRTFLGASGGVAIGANRLFIVDSSRMGASPVNHRVLIYENLAGLVPAPDAELPQDSSCPACVGEPTIVLGQADFEHNTPALERGFNAPTAVATDGVHLAVADTDNNRVLIWRSIPSANGALPDIVVGQPDMRTNLPRTDQTGLRGPQGVWFHNGKLIIADTQNGRVLIYNSIPSSNGAGADIVLGQPNFTTRPNPDLTVSNVQPSASNMLNPMSATTAGDRLFVADLGFNRVLIYNSFPTATHAAADVVVGQPNMDKAFSNNATKESALCEASGQNDKGEPTFPSRCAATLSFPRFALSDGTRLYIADGGNDRVLVYESIPTTNGAPADAILGQHDVFDLSESNSAGHLRAPNALAHDGTNLYVADPFSRRVLVFTPAQRLIRPDGVVNAASFAVHAQGVLTFDGDPKKDDEVKITIRGRDYTYKVADEDESLETVREALLAQINDDPGDPLVYARAARGEGNYAQGGVKFGGSIQEGDVITIRVQDRRYSYRTFADDTIESLPYIFQTIMARQRRDPDLFVDIDPADNLRLRMIARVVGTPGNDINYAVTVSEGATVTAEAAGDFLTGGFFRENLLLVARKPGYEGNDIDVSHTLSSNAVIQVTTSGPTLTGGNDAREAPPGTQIAIFGDSLADATATADASLDLPGELGGIQVYINGIRAPLYMVSPAQILAQVPFEIEGTSLSLYVRSRRADGQVAVSVAKDLNVTRAAPGLYALPGLEPRAGVVLHGMPNARGTVAIDAGGGTGDEAVAAGILVRISVNDRNYEYTTVEGDTTDTVRDKLVDLINEGDGDPDVVASADRRGFLSARSRVTFEGEIKEGDTVTITIGGRNYRYVVTAADTLRTVANQLINAINAPPGDPEVTAKLSSDVGVTAIDIIARSLGTEGNSITLTVGTSTDAKIKVTTDAKDGKLGGGSTPAVVILTARRVGREGDDIRYAAFVPGGSVLTVTASTTNLCCGNDFMTPVTPENPAVPGEIIIVFGTGLGLTSPRNGQEGLETGRPVPEGVEFKVPLHPDDFVSSLAAGKTATVQFVGLMPGQVGVYIIRLLLNPDLPDDPMARLTIAQGLFVSNIITLPIRNRSPRPSVF